MGHKALYVKDVEQIHGLLQECGILGALAIQILHTTLDNQSYIYMC